MNINLDFIKNLKNKSYTDITEQDLNTPVIYRHSEDNLEYIISQCAKCNNCYFKLNEIPYSDTFCGMGSKCVVCGYIVRCYNILEHKRKNIKLDSFKFESLNRCTVFFPKCILI